MASDVLQRMAGRCMTAGAMLLALSLGLTAGVVCAQESPAAPAPAAPSVTNVWVDMPLREILRDVSMQAGVTIAVDPSVADQLVSLEADRMPLEECLRKVTAAQGLTIRKMGESFYIVGGGAPGSPSFDEVADSARVCLKYITARHLRQSLPKGLQPYVSSGERSTEVLVFAPPPKMKHILGIVEQMDVRRRQVMLEALAVELSQEAGEKLGIDWERWGPHTVVGLANSNDGFTGTLSYASIRERDFRKLMVTLHMLVRNGSAAIKSRPRVATLNGEQAVIDISLEEYFTIATDVNGAVLRTELQVVKSGVVLKMTPQIGEAGDITVDVSTEVSDVATRRSNVVVGNSDGGTLPVIRRRKADTKVRVKEGDAIVIGGLVETQERREIKRVPILGYIPLLGVLFRSTRESTVEKEVVIFITPRLMDSGGSPLSERHSLVDVQEELAALRSPASPSQPDKAGADRPAGESGP